MRFVEGPVRVSVPATSANLGPGFDSLGLALDLRDRVSAHLLPAGLAVVVSGEGASDVPLDERHLVVRSMRAAFDVLGGQPSGLALTCENVIPHARGLGSSSAAIVAGAGLARALVDDGVERLPDDELFALAAELEGHPDNVAPALFGGFVVSGREDDRFYAAQAPLAEDLSAVVLVPPDGVATSVARGLLPTAVTHEDAAADAGRTALLVVALGGRPDLLLTATRDYLHQAYREPAMPETIALVRALRADGVPAVVSGAGPTVLAFVGPGGDAASVLARRPPGWLSRHLPVERRGLLVG